MQIQDVVFEIEQSLANLKSLSGSALPPALQGLRHLPLGSYEPQVSIRYRSGKQYRKIRRDADASYFEPEACEVVIRFVASDEPRDVGHPGDAEVPQGDGDSAGALDYETAIGQLLDDLAEVESAREFVSLKWFRDQYLPSRGHEWSSDPRDNGVLLRHATGQRLILTSQVPNPNNPLHPVTAIRVNRRHPRFQPDTAKRGVAFAPIPIRGGTIADTVLGDRR